MNDDRKREKGLAPISGKRPGASFSGTLQTPPEESGFALAKGRQDRGGDLHSPREPFFGVASGAGRAHLLHRALVGGRRILAGGARARLLGGQAEDALPLGDEALGEIESERAGIDRSRLRRTRRPCLLWSLPSAFRRLTASRIIVSRPHVFKARRHGCPGFSLAGVKSW